MKYFFTKFLKSLFSNLDLYVTIGVAIYATYLGAMGGKIEHAVAATALAISIIAFSQLRERTSRKQLNMNIASLGDASRKLLDGITADEFFTRSTSEKSYIKHATKQIFMVQETGQLIAERYREELVDFLKSGGFLRVILVSNSSTVSNYMAYRNKQLYSIDLMTSRMKAGLDTLNVLKREAGDFSRNIEVRFINYPIDFTSVFTDPEGDIDSRKALVRIQGFKVAFNDKLDFRLEGATSKDTFELYYTQAKTMWNISNRCTFLTGAPRAGKTTALRSLSDRISANDEFNIRGFLTEEVLNDSRERTGFNVKLIGSSSSHRIATKNSSGVYSLDTSVMNTIILPEIKDGIDMSDGIFILDEIGKIQIQNQEFKKLVMDLIENTRISIIGIISNEDDACFEQIKGHLRVGIIEVGSNNRSEIPNMIFSELKQ